MFKSWKLERQYTKKKIIKIKKNNMIFCFLSLMFWLFFFFVVVVNFMDTGES